MDAPFSKKIAKMDNPIDNIQIRIIRTTVLDSGFVKIAVDITKIEG